MPTERAADPGKAQFRQQWYAALNAQIANAPPANSLAARFASFADTVQTRLDTTNGVGPSLTGSLEAQVGRALSQVLRQAPAVGAAGAAYNGAGAAYPGAGAAYPGAAPLVAQAMSVATLGGTGGPPASRHSRRRCFERQRWSRATCSRSSTRSSRSRPSPIPRMSPR